MLIRFALPVTFEPLCSDSQPSMQTVMQSVKWIQSMEPDGHSFTHTSKDAQ